MITVTTSDPSQPVLFGPVNIRDNDGNVKQIIMLPPEMECNTDNTVNPMTPEEMADYVLQVLVDRLTGG